MMKFLTVDIVIMKFNLKTVVSKISAKMVNVLKNSKTLVTNF
jgi:hypothetical protein